MHARLSYAVPHGAPAPTVGLRVLKALRQEDGI